MLNRLATTVRHISKTTMAAPKSDITLYTTQTPNGIKISIALEELGCACSIPSTIPHDSTLTLD